MGNRRATSSVSAPTFPRDEWAVAVLERATLLPPGVEDIIRSELPEWVASTAIQRGADGTAVAAALAKAAHVPLAFLDQVDAGAAHAT